MRQEPTILVVANPLKERLRLGGWIEGAGYDVITCTGPRGGIPCPGLRGRCPIAEEADAVVLDLTLEDDSLGEGIPGWQVVPVYVGLGLGVVALADPGDVRLVEWSPLVEVVPRSVDRSSLIAAVEAALARGRPLVRRGAGGTLGDSHRGAGVGGARG